MQIETDLFSENGHFNWRKSTIAKTPVTSKFHRSFAFRCISLQYSMCISEVDVAAKGNILSPFLPRCLHLRGLEL